MTRTWTVSIYLLKKRLSDSRSVFGTRLERLDEFEVAAGATAGTLYVDRSPAKAPDWTRLFAGATTRPLDLERPTFGAVLLLSASRRRFAVTFGTGRHLLDPACYERRFGLRAALNTVDPEAIRSIQSRTFNDSALHVHRQSSKLNDIVGLEVNVDRDLLVNLGGATFAGEVGKRLAGSDAARLTDEFELRQLRSKCTDLLHASRKTTYRSAYPWVDTIEPIADPNTVASLDAQVAERLYAKDLTNVDVYPPEEVDETITKFGVSRTGSVMEPNPTWLRGTITKINAPDAAGLLQALRSKEIRALDENGTLLKRWPIWDCLHLEHRIGRKTYILDRRSWYLVERKFATIVNDFVANLKPSGLQLPDALHNEVEGDYNARIAATRAGLHLTDKKLVTPTPGETRIEVCDLFSSQGHMVHVKRRKGGSSSLSHLFGQALVSGQLFARSPEYRARVRDMLRPTGYVLPKHAKPPDHPIVLALLMHTPTGNQGNLPFFSKVNLREQARTLQTAGFDVFLDEIQAPIP